MIYTMSWEPGFDSKLIPTRHDKTPTIDPSPAHEQHSEKKIKIWYDILPDACFNATCGGTLPASVQKNQQPHEKSKRPTPSDREDGFKEGSSKGKGGANPVSDNLQAPEQSNRFGALGDQEAETTEVENVEEEVVPPQPNQNAPTDPISAFFSTGHEVPQAPSLQEQAPVPGSGILPDLNVTPTASTGTPPGKQREKKVKKKDKRSPVQTRRSGGEGGGRGEGESVTPTFTQNNAKEAEDSDSSSSEGEEVEENKLWKKTEGKTQKGVKEELKTRERQTVEPETVMPGSTVIMDYAVNEVRGTALVIHESIKILEHGVKGSGNMVWACIESHGSSFFVTSVYGPHHAGEKVQFYNWLKNRANDKNWVLVGDWNMVVTQEDSSGPMPVLKRGPLQAWNEVQMV
ncbi:hypothetical protein R1sor_007078 [Riccia sorocarpa]|uniref:RNA-directed DNA polymerase, eukaryota, Reverse transcriptase zinc-binding domain protein n=1 Tax=Riccia sorocarpa TaxID=122646 RepID=A0ABD3HSA7_9MARC